MTIKARPNTKEFEKNYDSIFKKKYVTMKTTCIYHGKRDTRVKIKPGCFIPVCCPSAKILI